MRAISCLYHRVPLAMQHCTGEAAVFESVIGVKQGCPLSPLLFGLYIDDLEATITGSSGVMLPHLNNVDISLLLYADDLALMSSTSSGLAVQFETLTRYAERWGLSINIKKTKIVTFCSKRQYGSRDAPQLNIGADTIQEVDTFSYLGMELHSTAAVTGAGAHRALLGERALHALQARCKQHRISNPVIVLQLFHALVTHVYLYAVEVWGTHAPDMSVEHDILYRAFLRRLLGVRKSTPTAIVAAELGEEPVCIRRTRSVARYWNRVVQLPESRLVRLALMASVQLSILEDVPQRHRQRCWAEQAANLLSLNLTVQSQVPDITTASLIECQQERYTSELTSSPLTKIKQYIALLGSDCFMFVFYIILLTSHS